MRNRKDRRLLVLCIAACLCIHCGAQTGGYRLDFKLSKRNFADTIAIEYERHQVFVPVSMGGRTYRFLLDTGSGQAVVYHDTPIDGCRPSGTILSHDAIGRTNLVPMVELPPLTLGTLTINGCQATVQQRAIRRKGIDGILGFDLVCSGLLMKIDVRNRRLIVTDRRRTFDKEPGHTIRYELNYHVPYLRISPFRNFTDKVLFDTGSRQFYAMNKQRFDEGERYCLRQDSSQVEGRSYGRHAIGLHGTEPYGPVVFLELNNLLWGDFAFHDVHTRTTQGGSHLGAQVLYYGAVVINPRRKQICFQPYDDNNHCIVANEQLQKAIVNEGGRPVVGLIWEKSESYKAGLRQGDIILRADNYDIRSFADYLAFRPLIGKRYHFIVLDRRGVMKEVVMTW